MAAEPGTDASVIERSVTDAPRFAEIFDRHAPRIFAFLARRLGRSDAEDLLGEVFRVAFERRSSYRLDRPDAGPWLYGIAANLVAQMRRRELRHLRARARLDGQVRAGGGAEGDIADTVAARLHTDRVLDELVEALAALPDGDRDALLLWAVEELPYAEIAEALDVPVGTVRSRISRARGRLRERVPSLDVDHDLERRAR